MRKIINKTSSILLCILFFAYPAATTNAQAIKGFTLAPTGNIIPLEHQISNEYRIYLTNNEDVEVQINSEIFETNNNDEILEDPFQQISSLWIKIISEREFSLAPGQSKEIVYAVNFPEDIPQILLQSTIFLNVNTFDSATDSYKFLIKMPYLITFVPVSESNQSSTLIEVLKQPNNLTFTNSNSIEFKISNSIKNNSFTKPIVYFQVLNNYSIPVYSEILNEGARAIVNDGEITFAKTFNVPSDLLKDIGNYTIEIMSVDSISMQKTVVKTSFTNIPAYYVAIIAVIAMLMIFVLRKRKRTKRLASRKI